MSPEDRAAIEQTRLSHKISQAKPKLKRGVAQRMKSPLQAVSVAGGLNVELVQRLTLKSSIVAVGLQSQSIQLSVPFGELLSNDMLGFS